MSLIKDQLPQITTISQFKALQFDAPADLLSEYAQIEPPKAMGGSGNVIDMLDIIGEDFWGDGVTAKAVGSSLKSMAGQDIRVRINSPGGNVSEGISIFNMLRSHEGKVTVEVLGMAASIASIIAMAGDEIVMGEGTMMMIHNAWGVTVGNRHDFRDTADLLEKFDGSMAKIYVARTGRERSDIEAIMDGETFLDAEEAVDGKFATRVDKLVNADAKLKAEESSSIMARRRVEAALARDGVPRKDRAGMISQALTNGGQRDATTETAARDAGFDADWLEGLCNSLKS